MQYVIQVLLIHFFIFNFNFIYNIYYNYICEKIQYFGYFMDIYNHYQTIIFDEEKKEIILKRHTEILNNRIEIVAKDSLNKLEIFINWLSFKVFYKKIWVKVKDPSQKVGYLSVKDLSEKLKITPEIASNLKCKPNSTVLHVPQLEIENAITEILELEKININTATEQELEGLEKQIEIKIKELRNNLIKDRFDKLYQKYTKNGLSDSCAINMINKDSILIKLKNKLEILQNKKCEIDKIIGSHRDRLIVRLINNQEFKNGFKEMFYCVINKDSKEIIDKLKDYRTNLIKMASIYIKENKADEDVEIEDMQIVLEAGFKAMKQNNLEEYANWHNMLLALSPEEIEEDKHPKQKMHLIILQGISSTVFTGPD